MPRTCRSWSAYGERTRPRAFFSCVAPSMAADVEDLALFAVLAAQAEVRRFERRRACRP